MTGSFLKSRLSSIEPNLAETAKKLNMSRQAFYQALEAADVKTGLVERIAALYNKPIGFFFSQEGGVEIKEVERSFNSNGDEIIKELTAIINKQEQRIAQLTDKLLGL